MPDIGVLELEIREKASAANGSVEQLATALERIKTAVDGAVKISTVAAGIEKLGNAIKTGFDDATIQKLNQVMDALSKLNNMGNINIKLNIGDNAKKAVDSVKEATSAATGDGQKTGEDLLENMAEGMSRLELLQEKVALLKGELAGLDDNAFNAKKIVNYKLQIDRLEEQIAKLQKVQENAFNADNMRDLVQSGSQIDAYKAKVQDLKAKLEEGISTGKWDTGKIADVKLQIERLEEKIQKLQGTAANTNIAEAVGEPAAMTDVTGAIEEARDAVSGVNDGMKTVTASVEEAGQSAEELRNKLEGVREEAENISGSGSGTGFFRGLVEGTRNLTSGLTGVLSQMRRVATYRAYRAIIKEITSAFKEGVENVYWYSKAIGSDFSEKIDSAASALQQMKNSIGAAVAPLISSLIPYLRVVISYFVTLVNYVNQFFSLLSGSSTWTRAVETAADAFSDTASSASSASDSVKDLLADWDELNIIQSTSSGSGSGSAGTDYTSMFEETNEYSQWIKDLVEGIEDTFGNVLNLVGQIAGAILAWKVSSAFSGIVGMLSGLVSAGIALNITLGLVEMFDKEYLKTGDEGWLITSLLTAFVGSSITSKIVGAVLNAEAATYTIPLTLALSAVIDIATLLGAVDVSAISKESLLMSCKAALETGAASGYLAYAMGATKLVAIGSGLGVAMMTFGFTVGIKTIARAVTGDLTSEEKLKGIAISSLAMGLGAATFAKLALGQTLLTAGIFGGAVAGLAALVTFGAVVGIEATTKAVNSGITEEVIIKDIESSLAMGGAVALSGKMLIPGMSWGQAAGGGAGGALLVAGALVGVQATVQASKEGLSEPVVVEDLISACLVGSGIGLSAGMLFGVGAAAAATIGSAAALATFGALVAVQAIIGVQDEEPIKWGKSRLTNEQITTFVNSTLFSVDVPVTIKIIQAKVSTVQVKKSAVEEKLASTLGTMEVIRLGLAKSDDYSELKKEILGDEGDGSGGLIGKINEYIDEAKGLGKLVLQFTPTLVGEDQTDVSTWFESYTTGWATVNEWATAKGDEIGRLLSKAEQNALEEGEADILNTLLNQLTDMTQAITKAKMNSEALGNLQFSVGGLMEDGELSQEDFNKIVEYYTSYKAELQKQNEELANAAYIAQGELVAALSIINPDSEAYKQAKAKYEEMGRNLMNAAKEGMEESAASGTAWLTNLLMEKYSQVLPQVSQLMVNRNYEMDNPFEGLDWSGMSTEEIAGEINQWLIQVIQDAGDYGPELSQYISALGLNAFTFIRNDETATNILQSLLESVFGSEKTKEILNRLTPEITEAAKETTETFNEAVQDGMNSADKPEVPAVETVDVDTSSVDEAKEEVVEFQDTVKSAQNTANTLTLDDITMNVTGVTTGANKAASAIEEMAKRIRDAFATLDGLSFSFDANSETLAGAITAVIPVQTKASGGFITSGDLVMANENGRIEMMGKMGNQPVVANNEMIIEGISSGVKSANSEQTSLQRQTNELLRTIANKDFTAVVKASSSLGRVNSQSSAAYSRVTGR